MNCEQIARFSADNDRAMLYCERVVEYRMPEASNFGVRGNQKSIARFAANSVYTGLYCHEESEVGGGRR